MTQSEFIVRLLVAIGIGCLMGLEREHNAMKEKVQSVAGIRTFVFVVLLGFIGAMTSFLFSPWIYFGVLLAIIIIVGISYWITASRGDIGATTESSVLIAFFLGSLTFLGFIEISLMITVVAVVLLSAKITLKAVIGKITGEELYDFIRFTVLVLLVFPFLPNETYGPYNVINPHEIGLVIILTSGLGFVGYVLMKFFGAEKGILLSGLIGGLVSSTATTWIFAKKSRENERLSLHCATAIFAASAMMIVRVFVWTFLFNRLLFEELYLAMLVVLGVAVLCALYFYFKQRKANGMEDVVRKDKPLDLHGALVFGFLYTVILLIVSYANENLGDEGMLVSSAIAGFSDIDAITISISKLTGSSLDVILASKAVLVAASSNTLVKMGIGIWTGGRLLRKYLYIGYGAIILSAVIAFLIL
ncbi:hypothetical protein FLJC2902T_10410 [Flavobacterium limnosediminis JC2902]|uniref:Uncharacterized protein n=2 Tax=Flavobacterium TaxID=237 RepID=V6SS40_9FLAO|nr:hypothetical protein FLJC2902T_10410 [Flavobacterium limnosediminis JC2902]